MTTQPLNFYRVEVTQEWVSGAKAIILATSEREARMLARSHIDHDILNAEDNGCTTYGSQIGLSDALRFKDITSPDEWFIMPSERGGFDVVESHEFFAHPVFTPEALEQERIKAIEKNNGQIDLPINGNT
jgi:hypothetical protein